MKIYHLVINGQIAYVGQTKNVNQRYRQHKWLLIHNKHQNKELQRLYNQAQSFTLVVIQITDDPNKVEHHEIIKNKTKQRDNRQIIYSVDELRDIHKQFHSK